MTLSIRDAAAERPHAVGLIVDGEELSFAELDRLATRAEGWLDAVVTGRSDRPLVALDALPTAEALGMLYALLSRRVAVALLDPRLSAVERRELLIDFPAMAVAPPIAGTVGAAPAPARRSAAPGGDEEAIAVVVFSSG